MYRCHIQELDEILAKNSSETGLCMIGNPCHPNRFWPYRKLFRKEFAHKKATHSVAERKLQDALNVWHSRNPQKKSTPPTVVGVHVRRTDYSKFLKNYVETSYFDAAFNYFRKK